MERYLLFPTEVGLTVAWITDILHIQSAVISIVSSSIPDQDHLKFVILYTFYWTFTVDLFIVFQIIAYPFKIIKFDRLII